MKRAARTVFVFILMLAMFFVVVSAGVIRVHADGGRGDDALFTDLPTEGMVEGKVPSGFTKVVVLRAPNVGSPNDDPAEDLKTADRYIAEGLSLMLEQQIQYRPQLTTDNAVDRVRRFNARLADPEVPHAGDKEFEGRKHARLDEGLKTFNADVLFVLSFVHQDDGALGLVYRYSADTGVHAASEWAFGKLGTPEPDTVTRRLEGVVGSLCEGVGEQTEHAPVPPLVTSDKALRLFARMTLSFTDGRITEAWIEYEALLKADPRAGRSAHYAMEIFLALSEEQSNGAENVNYLQRAIKAGREALKHVPNDTHIRGRLGWIGGMHFNRMGFARKAIEQALKVQPTNINEIERYLAIYKVEDAAAQVEWLKTHALPRINDGSVERVIATLVFNRGDYAGGVDWYKKAQAIAPGDFETQLSAGLCGFYKAEKLAKARSQDEARDAYADATDSFRAALRIDMQEVAYLYEFYVRAATHEYTWLPTNSDDLTELFLVQAALTGLQSNSRTFQWDRLVKDILGVQKRLLKEVVEAPDPQDELYVLKLIARLRLSSAAQDADGVVHSLWLIKQAGYRPDLYIDYMRTFGPIVDEYKPPAEEKPDQE